MSEALLRNLYRTLRLVRKKQLESHEPWRYRKRIRSIERLIAIVQEDVDSKHASLEWQTYR